MNISNLFERLRKSLFIKNTGWMITERVYQMLVSLIVGVLTARYLGPSNYGIINYVAAFIQFGVPICGLGLEGVLVKRYVDDPKKTGEYVGTAIFMEFVVSLVALAVIVVIVSCSNAGDQVKCVVAILESFQLLFKSCEPIEFYYQSMLKSKYTSTVKMIAYTVMSTYRVALLILKKSVEWFAFATSLDMIIIGVLYLVLYNKHRAPKLKINLGVGKSLIQDSYHFILSSMMVVLYSQMDKIMLQSMLGDHDVGLYSAAHTVCSLWFFIPGAIIASSRPIIHAEKNRNEFAYKRRLQELYASIFWMGCVVGIIISCLSGFIISVLYGQDYVPASGALSIGIWYGVFAQLGTARGIWILAERKNKYVKYYLALGVVINFVLNIVLIKMMGINGAAIATLVTQFFTAVVAPALFPATRQHTILLLDSISLRWLKERKQSR